MGINLTFGWVRETENPDWRKWLRNINHSNEEFTSLFGEQGDVKLPWCDVLLMWYEG